METMIKKDQNKVYEESYIEKLGVSRSLWASIGKIQSACQFNQCEQDSISEMGMALRNTVIEVKER
ncbi:hypothetical protein [Latilactobacillus curvatus]|uniref:hypothetical protein n=1 Tax=Latilactobacillus curvatus TaxID=28038 RepID=UPI00223B9E3C|nr:hypothetical protein [Latilactobacillus curvatus]MCS8581160.1 hypothetical protein [Latilactobacillus curvatus]MCS8606334.1 hypothetical protein [Latilactobacillus curvatus]